MMAVKTSKVRENFILLTSAFRLSRLCSLCVYVVKKKDLRGLTVFDEKSVLAVKTSKVSENFKLLT
jgi:hypothetical protein